MTGENLYIDPKADAHFLAMAGYTLPIEGPEGNDIVNDPNGGLTKFGIAQKQHPNVDVANLTQAGALAIYKAEYFDPAGCGNMPWPLSYVVFDCSVNNGVGAAVRLLQATLGVEVDGDLGPETLLAAGKVADPHDAACRLLAKRAVYDTELGNWRGNAEGWMYRNAVVAMNCLRTV